MIFKILRFLNILELIIKLKIKILKISLRDIRSVRILLNNHSTSNLSQINAQRVARSFPNNKLVNTLNNKPYTNKMQKSKLKKISSLKLQFKNQKSFKKSIFCLFLSLLSFFLLWSCFRKKLFWIHFIQAKSLKFIFGINKKKKYLPLRTIQTCVLFFILLLMISSRGI